MGVDISAEVLLLGITVLMGVLSGLLYDFFGLERRILRGNALSVAASDILFWIVISVGTANCFFAFNDGIMRWYMFFGMIVGSVLYFLLLSRFVNAVLLFAARLLKKTVLLAIRIVSAPIMLLYRLTVRICAVPILKIVDKLRIKIKKNENRGRNCEETKKIRGRTEKPSACSGDGGYNGGADNKGHNASA